MRWTPSLIGCLLLLVFSALPVQAQVQVWHDVTVTPPQTGGLATTLDMDGVDGTIHFIAESAATQVRWWRYDFPAADGEPTFGAQGEIVDPFSGFPFVRVASTPNLALFGSGGVTDLVGTTASTDTLRVVRAAAVDAAGTAGALIVVDPSGTNPDVLRRTGPGTWSDVLVDVGGQTLLPSGAWFVLVDDGRAIVIADGGDVYTTADVLSDVWDAPIASGFGVGANPTQMLRDAAWLSSGNAVFTSLDGLLIVDPVADTATPCATPSGETFSRIAQAQGTVYALLDRDVGGNDDIYTIPDFEAACADGLQADEVDVFATGSPAILGVAAWTDTSTTPPTAMAVALHMTIVGNASWKILNRPPGPPGAVTVDPPDAANATTVTAGAAVDPDAASVLTYGWSCPALTDGQTVTITAMGDGQTATLVPPSVCPAAGETIRCDVTAIDGDVSSATATEFDYTIVGEDLAPPTLASPMLLANNTAVPPAATDRWTVSTGQALRAEVTAMDNCSLDIQWSSVDALIAPTAGVTQVSFNAPATAGTYRLQVAVDDQVNAPPAPLVFTLDVIEPPTLTVTCADQTVTSDVDAFEVPLAFAGTNADALDYPCPADAPACVEPAAGRPAIAVAACSEADRVEVTFQPVDPNGFFTDINPVTCVVDVSARATPPSITRVSPEEIVVPLDESGAGASIVVDGALDGCDASGVVRWDLQDVHAAFRTGCGSACEQPVVAGVETLALKSEPIGFNALTDTIATVRAHVVDEDGDETDPLIFTLRFVPVADLGVRAGVRASIDAADARAVARGEIARVRVRVETSLGFALPRLALDIEDGELAIVPERLDVAANACGASATVSTADGTSRVVAEGVTSLCPLEIDLLARRGLASGALTLAGCAWGTDELPIAPCTSTLSLERPRGLGCTTTPTSSSAWWVLFAATLWSLGRRRRRPRR